MGIMGREFQADLDTLTHQIHRATMNDIVVHKWDDPQCMQTVYEVYPQGHRDMGIRKEFDYGTHLLTRTQWLNRQITAFNSWR